MKYQDFEHRAKDILGSDQVAVDTRALLASLDIAPPRRRKGWIIWTALGLLLAVSAAFWLGSFDLSDYSMQSSVNEIQHKQEAVLSQDVDQRSEVEDALASIQVSDEGATTTMTKDLPAENSSETIIAYPLVEATDTEIDLQLIADSKISSNGSEYGESTGAAIVNHKKAESQVKEAIENSTFSEAKNMQETVEIPVPVSNTSAEVFAVDQLTTAAIAPLAIDDTRTIAVPTDKIKCPTFKIGGSPWSYSIIPEVGYMLAQQDLEDNSMEPAATTALRMEEEEALEGLQAALYGRLMHEAVPVYLKAGISYSRISHRMPLEYSYTEVDTTQGIISITESPTGDTVTTIIGDIITETMVSGNTTKHYYTHQWDLPIALGYEQPLGGLTVGVEGGVNINLRTNVKGSILRTPSEFGEAVTETDVVRRVGLGFFGGVHVGKYFDGFGEIYLAARARYIPDISPEVTNTDQKYMLYGLHAGYVHHF